MKNIDSVSHVMGKSIYVDDLPELVETIHSVILSSPIAHGKLLAINTDATKSHKDLIKIITAKDIPGENQIGGIIQDEELLVDSDISFIGQPIAIIVAKSLDSAYEIREKVKLEYDEISPIIDPRIAFDKGMIIGKQRTFQIGDIEKALARCDKVITDSVITGGQEHIYLETQGAYAFPTESGYKIISATQGPTAVQKGASKVLGMAMHMVEVEVTRIGGGFGGKEDQATPYACMAVLASYITKKPVKLIFDRIDDIKMTGKRHPYVADYKIGMIGKKIFAYEVTFYQNTGAAADLAPAILERILFHSTNSYFIPNVKATAVSCKTNLPPNTAFRGFGAPQSMFVLESAIHKVAKEIGIKPEEIQESNLISNGDEFPYGQIAEKVQISKTWNQLLPTVRKHIREIKNFNNSNDYVKMGYSFMPITFGISFTNTSLNQAGALIHIYQDGSIGVATGAIEMGQGVNTRILEAVSYKFSVSPDRIKIESTNTTKVSNASPSAASATHELNGKAAQQACDKILARLLDLASEITNSDRKTISLQNEIVYVGEKRTTLSWNDLVQNAYLKRVDLAAHGFYSTPEIYFDRTIEKGHPFAYHTYGTAFIQVKVDCIRGIYELERVDIVHDSGKAMNTEIDIGQIEGGVVQGLGWMLLEDLVYDEKGRLLSDSLSTYKIPDIHFTPKEINIEFLKGYDNPLGLMGSKAVGEPPFMYGIGGYFAVRYAIAEFNEADMKYQAPLTPERILLGLYTSHRHNN